MGRLRNTLVKLHHRLVTHKVHMKEGQLIVMVVSSALLVTDYTHQIGVLVHAKCKSVLVRILVVFFDVLHVRLEDLVSRELFQIARVFLRELALETLPFLLVVEGRGNDQQSSDDKNHLHPGLATVLWTER